MLLPSAVVTNQDQEILTNSTQFTMSYFQNIMLRGALFPVIFIIINIMYLCCCCCTDFRVTATLVAACKQTTLDYWFLLWALWCRVRLTHGWSHGLLFTQSSNKDILESILLNDTTHAFKDLTCKHTHYEVLTSED